MKFALDINGSRISAADAVRREVYSCPVCGGPVILRDGPIKDAHFAHENNACSDNWNYDLSEWHFLMQSRFPAEQREVVIKHNGQTHRADILCGNCVVEFQHSPISADEIAERNRFYTSAGYNIAWVFDLQEQYDNGQIVDREDKDGLGYRWKYPKQSLKSLPRPNSWAKKNVLFFYWINTFGEEEFNRVIWSSDDYDGLPNFKTFFVWDRMTVCPESADDTLVVQDFFLNKDDLLQQILSEHGDDYAKKVSGVKGLPRSSYICPRRPDSFGILAYGENGCLYCRYCAAIKHRSKGFESFCYFPNQVRELEETHPGYECSDAPTF